MLDAAKKQPTSKRTQNIHLEHTPGTYPKSAPNDPSETNNIFSLVVSTPLKNIRQIGSFPLGRGEHKKYLSCHHLVLVAVKGSGVCFRDKLENS